MSDERKCPKCTDVTSHAHSKAGSEATDPKCQKCGADTKRVPASIRYQDGPTFAWIEVKCPECGHIEE